MLLTRAHRRCWYHWILALHSTPSTTPFSSVDYKPASTYLDLPLHGSTPILRAQSICPYWLFHVSSYSVHHGRSARICNWFYDFSLFISPTALTVSSYGLLQQQYADDTMSPYPKIITILHLPNTSFVSILHTWFCYKGLALNPDKSEAIMFGTTQRSLSLPITFTVNVAGTLVQVSTQVRILGITLDSRLSFAAHISALSKSCFYHIRALRHIRSNLTLDCSKTFLFSCRLSPRLHQLDSCGISVKNISWLQCLQITLARVVKWVISISNTLQELHLLPIKWRIDYKVATLTYKLLESDEPTYLRSRFTSKIFRCALRSSADERQLEPCSSHMKIGSRAFCCVTPAIWNCLSYDIRAAPSVSIFWSRLKTHYFKLAF